MIIECPSCSARFRLPDTLGEIEGRRLRCSQCGHMWKVKSQASPMPGTAPELAAAEVAALASAPHSLPKRVKAIYASVYGAGLVCLGVLLSLWLVPSLWGHTPTDGLVLEKLSVEPMKNLGGERFAASPMYVLQGSIRNTADTPRAMPILRVRLKQADGAIEYKRSFQAGDKVLAAGESVSFMLEKLERPDPAGTHFIVDLGNRLELAVREDPARD